MGYSIKDAICFGDGFNDRDMLIHSGWGVAMENACDDVKRVSNYITKSNDEDGVAFAIDKFFPLNYYRMLSRFHRAVQQVLTGYLF